MSKPDIPVTAAIRMLRDKKIDFIPHLFDYEEKGGTHQTARELNVPEHSVIKTIVLSTDAGDGVIVLMHGDFEVSTREVGRILGVKSTSPADEKKALKLTGYQFGGTSPFGTRTTLPILVESTIFDLDKIYINGGKRGFIVEIDPNDLMKAFNVTKVSVGVGKS
jgi:Cys-tRNA(Pro) deacylase